MPDTLATLEAQLAELREMRATGMLKVRFSDGREIINQPGADLAAVVADIERRISELRRGRITTVRLSTSKGF